MNGGLKKLVIRENGNSNMLTKQIKENMTLNLQILNLVIRLNMNQEKYNHLNLNNVSINLEICLEKVILVLQT